MGNQRVKKISSFYSTNIKNQSEGEPPLCTSTEDQCTVYHLLHTRRAELKLKHVILFLRQLGHLLPDSLHECRGGEAAQGHAVHVLHHLGQALLGCCAGGNGRLLQCLVIFQGQPGGASLWVARMRESLYIPRQGNLKNKADKKSVILQLHMTHATHKNNGCQLDN